MKETWKEQSTLIIGLLIPVVMVLLIIGSIYLPRFFSTEQPSYDFLYMTGQRVTLHDGYRVEYFVEDGRLQRVKTQVPDEALERKLYYEPRREEARFYRYDVTVGASQEVSFEKASRLTLDEDRESPDGFEVVRAGHPIFFAGYSDREYVLRGAYDREGLDLEGLNDENYYQFDLLGWVVKK